jgi:hypothetical protein
MANAYSLVVKLHKTIIDIQVQSYLDLFILN